MLLRAILILVNNQDFDGMNLRTPYAMLPKAGQCRVSPFTREPVSGGSAQKWILSCDTHNPGQQLDRFNMNIFRLVGDLSHLAAILVLLLKIWKTRSCAGISGECIELLSRIGFIWDTYQPFFSPIYPIYGNSKQMIHLQLKFWVRGRFWLILARFGK